MSKVVTERPRRGSWLPSCKTGGRLTKDEIEDALGAVADDVPHLPGPPIPHAPMQFGSVGSGTGLKSGIKGRRKGAKNNLGLTRAKASAGGQYGWDSKDFTDVLGPLRGYLLKQVGRPWDKVYSELAANLDRRTMSGRHIWTHVWMDVQIHTFIGPDGKVWERPRFSWAAKGGYPVQGLYVHPRTKLLCTTTKSWNGSRTYGNWTVEPKVDDGTEELVADLTGKRKYPTWRQKDDARRELRRIHGIWYEVAYERVEHVEPAYWSNYTADKRPTGQHYVEKKVTYEDRKSVV